MWSGTPVSTPGAAPTPMVFRQSSAPMIFQPSASASSLQTASSVQKPHTPRATHYPQSGAGIVRMASSPTLSWHHPTSVTMKPPTSAAIAEYGAIASQTPSMSLDSMATLPMHLVKQQQEQQHQQQQQQQHQQQYQKPQLQQLQQPQPQPQYQIKVQPPPPPQITTLTPQVYQQQPQQQPQQQQQQQQHQQHQQHQQDEKSYQELDIYQQKQQQQQQQCAPGDTREWDTVDKTLQQAPPQPLLPTPAKAYGLNDTVGSGSVRSGQSPASSQFCSPGHGKGVVGVANCTLCHGLLNIFAGRLKVQTITCAPSLPDKLVELADRAMALRLSDEEEAYASSSLCRFHSLHKRRYETWAKCQVVLQRASTAGGGKQQLARVQKMGQELATLEAEAKKAEQNFLHGFKGYLRQLQQDVRHSLQTVLLNRARDLVGAWQAQIDEVDEQIRRRVEDRRDRISAALERCQDNAREDFWREEERKVSLKLLGCLVAKGRSTRGGAGLTESTKMLKELTTLEEAKRPQLERFAESHVAQKVERAQARKEREMNIWLSKMDELQTLQHLQATKDRELIFSRVEMTLRKLDEDQVVEVRLISGQLLKHITRLLLLTDSVLATPAGSKGDLSSAYANDAMPSFESFMYSVLRHEMSVEITPGNMSTTSMSSPNYLQHAFDPLSSGEGSPNSLGVELVVFSEFLGARFPTLASAVSAIDLTGTGYITCIELESWLGTHMYPGDPRALLWDLDKRRRGRFDVLDMLPLTANFLDGGLRYGRPPGSIATALVKRFRMGPNSFQLGRERLLESQRAASRCAWRIMSFLSEAWELAGSFPWDAGSLADSLLGYSQDALSGRRGLSQPWDSRCEASISTAYRSKHFLWGDANSRRSGMKFSKKDPPNRNSKCLAKAFSGPVRRQSSMPTLRSPHGGADSQAVLPIAPTKNRDPRGTPTSWQGGAPPPRASVGGKTPGSGSSVGPNNAIIGKSAEQDRFGCTQPQTTAMMTPRRGGNSSTARSQQIASPRSSLGSVKGGGGGGGGGVGDTGSTPNDDVPPLIGMASARFDQVTASLWRQVTTPPGASDSLLQRSPRTPRATHSPRRMQSNNNNNNNSTTNSNNNNNSNSNINGGGSSNRNNNSTTSINAGGGAGPVINFSPRNTIVRQPSEGTLALDQVQSNGSANMERMATAARAAFAAQGTSPAPSQPASLTVAPSSTVTVIRSPNSLTASSAARPLVSNSSITSRPPLPQQQQQQQQLLLPPTGAMSAPVPAPSPALTPTPTSYAAANMIPRVSGLSYGFTPQQSQQPTFSQGTIRSSSPYYSNNNINNSNNNNNNSNMMNSSGMNGNTVTAQNSVTAMSSLSPRPTMTSTFSSVTTDGFARSASTPGLVPTGIVAERSYVTQTPYPMQLVAAGNGPAIPRSTFPVAQLVPHPSSVTLQSGAQRSVFAAPCGLGATLSAPPSRPRPSPDHEASKTSPPQSPTVHL